MTTASLHELLTARDRSLAVTRPRFRINLRLPAVRMMSVWTFVWSIVMTTTQFVARHGLVLGGCAAFIAASAMVSTMVALITTGLALFFLEARRR